MHFKYASMLQKLSTKTAIPNCTEKTFYLTTSGYVALFFYISYLNTFKLNNA